MMLMMTWDNIASFFSGNKFPIDAPVVSVSPAVMLPTHTTTLTCAVPPQSSASGCYFSIKGKKEQVRKAEYVPYTSSCQLSATWEDIEAWLDVEPPSELQVGCYYTIRAGVAFPSDHSSAVSLVLLGECEKTLMLYIFITLTLTVYLSCVCWQVSCRNPA